MWWWPAGGWSSEAANDSDNYRREFARGRRAPSSSGSDLSQGGRLLTPPRYFLRNYCMVLHTFSNAECSVCCRFWILDLWGNFDRCWDMAFRIFQIAGWMCLICLWSLCGWNVRGGYGRWFEILYESISRWLIAVLYMVILNYGRRFNCVPL